MLEDKPETALARAAGLAIGPWGGIFVDDALRTSDHRIFALGDAVEKIDGVSTEAVLVPPANLADRPSYFPPVFNLIKPLHFRLCLLPSVAERQFLQELGFEAVGRDFAHPGVGCRDEVSGPSTALERRPFAYHGTRTDAPDDLVVDLDIKVAIEYQSDRCCLLRLAK
jgi:Pyridine nucleotide-disulphide oxidoreductase